MVQRTVLTWIDLETTGLDEKKGRILEYAIVFTDLALDELGSTESIIRQDVQAARLLMDDYCVQMHTDNGLLKAIEDAGHDPEVTYFERMHLTQMQLMRQFSDMRAHLTSGDDDIIFVIAGNTVGFDRRWLKEHMPELEKILHYRQLDVSAYKVAFPEIFGTQTSDAHRAMADIRASISQHEEMRRLVAIGKMAKVSYADSVQPTFDEDDGC